MYQFKSSLKSTDFERASALKTASANRLMSCNSKFVYQVLKDRAIIGGGPLVGSRREAQDALETMIANGELAQTYWSGITSVVMLDKEQNQITSYTLAK